MPHTTTPGNPAPANPAATEAAAAFIRRWRGVTASELSTAQSFVIQLCELLGVAPPHPTPEQSYMFERPITFAHGDGSTSAGRVDCYKRGHFVWESKKLKLGKVPGAPAQAAGSATPPAAPITTKAFDDALLKARAQAENYARALPAAEGRPPFVVVVDVGHVIELYAEFTRSGATYTPFPDPRSHRIRLEQLADPALRARLKALWTDPLGLDPSRISAKVTRAVAAELADLAKSLEAAGHAPQAVAAFLTRCLFSMFAEDVGLLPEVKLPGADGRGSFVHLLKTYRQQPATLAQMLKVFWAGMDAGGFNAAIAQDVLRFNGKLFKGAGADGYVLPLTTGQIDGLLRAASAKWQEVEPAIFGTLLERALNPTERHALGAHYTPRAYVERLVLPTVVEPLRADWANAQAAAVLLAREADELDGPKNQSRREAKLEEARAELRRFHHQLCTTRVLDPACGSGNFLYVTLEHLKRLEGEVINQLEAMGETQDKLGLEGETVTLQQLRGIELNARAAALAELVLWIGWLQWHVRTRGLASVAEPVVHDYGNIENRDAVLAYDRAEPALDADGKTLTRWDGVSFKTHPVTGEAVPDEAAQVVQWTYLNPRPADWPAADFIVGNPPFIGNKRMRDALGEGYAQALRATWPDMPDSADFVMYWWHKAALTVRSDETRQFGLITTNSISQTFNRRIVEAALANERHPLHLIYAIPDHPWVDSTAGAAVRISMTVCSADAQPGRLIAITAEHPQADGEIMVEIVTRSGKISSDFSTSLDKSAVKAMSANRQLSFMGVILVGDGFFLDKASEPLISAMQMEGVVSTFVSGTDLQKRARGRLVVDFTDLDESTARIKAPHAYQWLVDRVLPVRRQNKDKRFREIWWQFGAPRPQMRSAIKGLSRFIVTGRTAKHRLFQFLNANHVVESNAVVIACDSAALMGILGSQVHICWSEWMGATLEDRPHYTNSTVFETFPFPQEDTGLTPELTERIRSLAEQLDAHRKARQAAFESVTLTGLYNVLNQLRRGEPLAAKDKLLHEQGLVSVLQSLHDELDTAVLAAYGWSDLGAVPSSDEAARAAWTEALLERLVALNARRAAEEAAGTVRWLRPEFQDPARRAAAVAAAEAAAQAGTGTAEERAAAAPAPAPQQAGIDGVESKEQAAARAEAAETRRAESDHEPGSAAATATGAAQPWPPTLPEQVRAVAQRLAASPAPLSLAAIESSFKGKGPWKKGLPRLLETLEALGRATRVEGGWRG